MSFISDYPEINDKIRLIKQFQNDAICLCKFLLLNFLLLISEFLIQLNFITNKINKLINSIIDDEMWNTKYEIKYPEF